MGLSRNKVAVSEGAAGSPPFYGESNQINDERLTISDEKLRIGKSALIGQKSRIGNKSKTMFWKKPAELTIAGI